VKRKIPSFSRIIVVLLVTLAAVASVMPLYWMVTGSFKIQRDAMSVPPEFFPKNPTLENWIRLLTGNRPTFRWFFNSIFVSGTITLGAVVTSAMAGYAFGKKEFPGRELLFWTIIVTMALPRIAFIIPLYLMMRDLGWIDTYQGLIAPYICYPFGIFLVKQFMHTIPQDLIDAARIDGASELRIFTRLVMPLARPALGAIAIFVFVSSWNEYLWQLIMIDSQLMQTLPLGVSKLVSTLGSYDLGLAMAGATFAFIPMLAVFLIFQDYFVKGLTVGAVKG